VRVLFANSMRSLGGGEQWLLEAADGLSARAHAVAVAARSGSALAARAAERGHAVRTFPMRGDGDLASIAGMARWMRAFRPDVVCLGIKRAVRLGCAASALGGVRAVVERRGLLLPVRGAAIDRVVYGRCVGLLIANCEAIRESVVTAGLVPRERVRVIPNGIDPARVPSGGGDRVREELGIGPGDPLLAIVARLVRDKGHEHALRAFATIVAKRPSARLAVVGDGKLRGEIDALVRELKLDRSVILTGARGDVPAILDAADVLVVASLREGMPHSILEAMVAGTPVVSTAVAGVPEMIEDGREGLLVPPASSGALAEAIERVLSDRALATDLARAAGERVRDRFGLETMIDRLEECFEEALAMDTSRRNG
jgi:glycosyltransferase involved in cell wall biosynthesis